MGTDGGAGPRTDGPGPQAIINEQPPQRQTGEFLMRPGEYGHDEWALMRRFGLTAKVARKRMQGKRKRGGAQHAKAVKRKERQQEEGR